MPAQKALRQYLAKRFLWVQMEVLGVTPTKKRKAEAKDGDGDGGAEAKAGDGDADVNDGNNVIESKSKPLSEVVGATPKDVIQAKMRGPPATTPLPGTTPHTDSKPKGGLKGLLADKLSSPALLTTETVWREMQY